MTYINTITKKVFNPIFTIVCDDVFSTVKNYITMKINRITQKRKKNIYIYYRRQIVLYRIYNRQNTTVPRKQIYSSLFFISRYKNRLEIKLDVNLTQAA